MRVTIFANDEYYHIYNRGVDKRNIFLDRNDYVRFLHDLYEFNDKNPAIQYSRANVGGSTSNIEKKSREKLVEIICFCLMPNHFHLVLMQLVEEGITRFMHKIGTGYTMAFNIKRERSGSLFQGRFKSVHIENEIYLTHLSRYIHLNPVEIKAPHWKKQGIKNWKAVNEFLEEYCWSSYLDYIGKINFPSITNRKLILDIFGGEKEYRKFAREWLAKDFTTIEDFVLE